LIFSIYLIFIPLFCSSGRCSCSIVFSQISLIIFVLFFIYSIYFQLHFYRPPTFSDKAQTFFFRPPTFLSRAPTFFHRPPTFLSRAPTFFFIGRKHFRSSARIWRKVFEVRLVSKAKCARSKQSPKVKAKSKSSFTLPSSSQNAIVKIM
jgi:hypothetical protein